MDWLYAVVLTVHSVTRWLVIFAGAAAIVQAAVSLVSGGAFLKRHKLSNLGFMIMVDMQLLLGLILYFALSPITRAAFSDFGGAMKEAVPRYWAVEHLTGMLLGIIGVHVAYFFAKRVKSDRAKHLWGAVGFAVAMLIILGSIPWPFMPVPRGLW